MREFFSQQLDYIFFFYGLAFIILAAVTFALHRTDRDRIPWRWLTLFGLIHGVNEWLDLAAFTVGDQTLFLYFRLFILALSYICLLEFFRKGLAHLKGLNIPFFYSILLTIIAGWGLFFGLDALAVSIRYTLGLTGAWGGAYVIFHFQRKNNLGSLSLLTASAILFLYGMACGLVVPKADFYPAVLVNQEAFSHLTGLPIQLTRGILAVVLSICIWSYYVQLRKSEMLSSVREEINFGKWLSVFLVLVVSAGWIFTDYTGKQKEKDLQNGLLMRVKLAAATLNPADLKKLTWSDADLKSPVYQELKRKLILMQKAATDSRFVCLMGYRDHRTYVLVDSEAPASPDYSPPGQYYAEASEDYITLLSGAQSDIIGPEPDRWGSWITGVYPIGRYDGRMVHLVFDFDASAWLHKISLARLIPIVITFMIIALILTFFVMFQYGIDTREALASSEMTLRRVFDHVYDAIIVHDENGHIIDANDRMLSLYGVSRQEIGRLSVVEDLSSAENAMDNLHNTWCKVLDGENYLFEWVARRPHEGVEFPVEVHLCRMDFSGKPVIVATVRDLTLHKIAEKERNVLHEQFLQAQKMESVGRLAGGVAHDFNNMLAAILGYAELTLEYMTPDDAPHRECLLEIQKAGERAKALTRQLLAFGRNQVMEFRVVNLNQVIKDFEKLMKRLIGEDINVRTNLAPTLPAIMADISQLEQILLNLAVNARDAMPQGGELIISTEHIDLTDEYSSIHPDVKPGDYVFLTFSDTGSGMSDETRTRVFEPFFTTKDMGKGTGLGLSTVYGIVTQHGGHIDVTSSVGKGTTFRIFFPTTINTEETAAPGDLTRTDIPRRSLLVLVVEDDPAIRLLTCRFLNQLGHRVLEALDVKDAIRLCTEHRNGIDVLLTDVVMPDMTGRQLFEYVHELSPVMRVIYMSGYPEQLIAHHGVLSKGTFFLQKPFSSYDLARILQEAFKNT